jgi:hypothetical protein
MRVAVIDIGTLGKNLGWAIDEPDDGGADLDACVETLIDSLGKGPVALGFEAPQFVPLRDIRLRVAIASLTLACPRRALLPRASRFVPFSLLRLRSKLPARRIATGYRNVWWETAFNQTRRIVAI